MSIHSQYTDTRNFKVFNNMETETVPKNAVFASYLGEEIKFETEDILRYPINREKLAENPLNESERFVLGAIASYEVVTNKMLIDLALLTGFPADEKAILKAVEKLRKFALVHTFRFVSVNGECSSKIHCLTKSAGESAAKNLGFNVDVTHFNIAMAPEIIKKKLAANQIAFAYFKRYGSEISEFETSRRIAFEKDGVHAAVRPSLLLRFSDDSVLLYEVSRTERFWENTLRSKFERYKAVFDNWEHTGMIYKKPTLIICCESQNHASAVRRISDEIGINVLFTHDLLMFADKFSKHIFSFDESFGICYYQLSAEDEKDAI